YGWRGGEAVVERVLAHHRAGLRGTPYRRQSASGRALLDRQTVHIPDTDLAREEFPDVYASSRTSGSRTQASTPLLHGDEAIGVLALFRLTESRPFSAKQLSLLEAFASQAAIAITNARLFHELQQRTSELTEALEQQTATSDVLRVIASSPTDPD